MYGNGSRFDDNIEKWVLLYEPDEETIDHLTSLNFNIIIGGTEELLDFISSVDIKDLPYCGEFNNELSEELSKYSPPLDDGKLPSYSISSYFSDYTPHWSQIYSNKIPLTRHYNMVCDAISTGEDIIVIGIRCSGKTTLFMQLILKYETQKPKHYMIAPSLEDVETYIKLIGNAHVILFIDDCFRDTDAICKLLSKTNIQLVMFDRDFNYERQFHKFSTYRFKKIDITEIIQEDAQKIINYVPRDLKKNNVNLKRFKNDPTIVNLLAIVLKKTSFNFIRNFYAKDKTAADIFLMICYVHSCGVPCSFDMIYSYLGDDDYNWQEMYSIVNRVGKLIKDFDEFDTSYEFEQYIQDYYGCRSRYLAEKILASTSRGDIQLKDMLIKFTTRVPQYKICQYDKFRRSAYDAELVGKAFPDVHDGERFYELCSEKDDSEYIFQQAALYFAHNSSYKLAFNWIDKARSRAHYNRFSIDSTYAQIYFDVNIHASIKKMEEALDILKDCCRSDKRKNIHFSAFASRVIIYCKQSDNEEKKKNYLTEALEFVNEGLSENNKASSQKKIWELLSLKKDIQNRL